MAAASGKKKKTDALEIVIDDLKSKNPSFEGFDFRIEENKKLHILNQILKEEIHSQDFHKSLYQKFYIFSSPKRKQTIDQKSEDDFEYTNFHMSKVFQYINFFVTSGPLTKAEESILDDLLKLLKGYYIGRYSNFIERKDLRILKNTIYPEENSHLFHIFLSKTIEPVEIKKYKNTDL